MVRDGNGWMEDELMRYGSRLLWCRVLGVLGMIVLVGAACGVPADQLGIGAECATDDKCKKDDGQKCLTQFKGGYCGAEGCSKDADCPSGALCVTHEGKNYCFRSCADKSECNANRSASNESNCSANITRAEGTKGAKACVPPSG